MTFDLPDKMVHDYIKAKQEIERLGKKSSTFVELSIANGILEMYAKKIADHIFESLPK